jgi:CHAD domain-containing protein
VNDRHRGGDVRPRVSREFLAAAGADGTSFPVAAIAAALSTTFDVTTAGASPQRSTWLDTADSRLHRAGLTLREVKHGSSRQLDLDDGSGDAISVPTGQTAWPAPVDAISDEALRARIAERVGIRALVPACTVISTQTRLRLRDGLQKLVADAVVDEARVIEPVAAALPVHVTITAVRGYEPQLRSAAQALLAAGAAASTPGQFRDAIWTVATAGLIQPPRRRRDLDPDSPAASSVAAALLDHLDTVDQNAPGAVADIDTEFLHDLRVATRSTRALIKLAGDVLPGGIAERFAPEWRWVGAQTTPMRDLDVLLLVLAGRTDDVDVSGLRALGPLSDYLAERRRTELRRLRQALRSHRFSALVTDWRAALQEVLAGESEHGPAPATRPFAEQRMRRARRRIVRRAARLEADWSMDAVHDLRKRGKELRYLQDAFGAVADGRTSRSGTRELKALQDCLGDIRDACMHMDELTDFAGAARELPAATLMDIGAMCDRLGTRRDRAIAELPGRLRPVLDRAAASPARAAEAAPAEPQAPGSVAETAPADADTTPEAPLAVAEGG